MKQGNPFASHRRKTSLRLLLLLGLALSAGCMNTPRNGQQISDYVISLSGYLPWPDRPVQYYQGDWVTGNWYNVPHDSLKSSSSGVTDDSGTTWYPFSKSSQSISNARNQWKSAPASGSQRQIRTQIKSQANTGAGWFPLFSFDMEPSQTCDVSNGVKGLDIISNCSSSNSPVAEVLLKCGKRNQVPCDAYDIPTNKRCDRGSLANTTYPIRCSIPAGGEDQPVNVNGAGCNEGLAAVSGVCRNVSIEKMPIVTLELRVKSCDDPGSTWSDNDSDLLVDVGTGAHFLEVPGKELEAGGNDRFGFKPKNVSKLGDIDLLRMTVYGRKTCITEIGLVANDIEVFKKTYSSPLYLTHYYPNFTGNTVEFTKEDLRNYWTTELPHSCNPPASIPGANLQRLITGVIGHYLKTSDDFDGDFDSGGYVRVTRASLSSVEVRSKFRANVVIDGLTDVDVDVTVQFTLSFAFEDGKVAIKVSGIDLVNVGGDWGYDLLTVLTFTVADQLIEMITQIMITNNSSSLTGAMNASLGELPDGAAIDFSVTSATPPTINLTYSYLGSTIPPSTVNLCQ